MVSAFSLVNDTHSLTRTHAHARTHTHTRTRTRTHTHTHTCTGTKFHIEMLFQTRKGTGTGEIDLDIDTQDHVPVGEDTLVEPLDPGAYNVTWTVTAKPDPNCDPTQEPCEMWLPGNYTANVGTFHQLD